MQYGLIALSVAGAAVILAAWCYLQLRRWVHHAKGARILIADKRKVVLDAPITEWIAWSNMLGKDERSNGRVVYRGSRTSVAIAHPPKKAKK